MHQLLPSRWLRCNLSGKCSKRPTALRKSRSRQAGTVSALEPDDTISTPHRTTESSVREVTLDYTRDTDPVETKEWLDSLEGVIEGEGPERAHFLLTRVMDGARQRASRILQTLA